MTKLEKYANEVIERINKYNNCNEDEVVRLIYLSLGKKIAFDLNWVFGNDFTRAAIYYKEDTPDNIDEYISEEKWVLICKSIAYALKYIGQKTGINVETVQEDPNQFNPYPHVYNKITKKDGTEYNVDLYADLPNIYMNKRTEFFGFIDYVSPRIFTREKLEAMDYKFGYISDTKPYTDEYYYLLKDYTSRMESIYEKMKIILENPSPYMDFNLEYDERRRYIINTINYILKNEHDVDWKWEWLDCYYYRDNDMVPKEIIYLKEEDDMYFFEYNLDNNNFNQISDEELVTLLSNGLRLPERCSSPEYSWIRELGSKTK